jgi:histidyl-tRNA synthetase
MASEEFLPLQGMADLSAPEIRRWQHVEAAARRVFGLYGYDEVRTPVLERATVFERSLGDTTDVVQKEMYVFETRGGQRVALRPEGTAGVMRYVASRGQEADEARLWYAGPMFRGERPQAGRRRQFHQIGAERLGPPCAAADAETIALQVHLLRAFGLRQYAVQLNTRGLPEDRRAVQDGLRAALAGHTGALCEDCLRRLETNVLRVLDCKQEGCRAVADALPPVTSFMAPASREYLAEVQGFLASLEIPAAANPRLIRGLDYYVHTVWEISHGGLGAQDALAGGGRYQIALGSRTIEGVGFALGVERVVMALEHDLGADGVPAGPAAAWVVSFGDRALRENLKLVQVLRSHGVRCGLDLAGRSMKAQMRAANKAGAVVAVIRGDAELDQGIFQVKDMTTGTQRAVALPELMEDLRGRGLAAPA